MKTLAIAAILASAVIAATAATPATQARIKELAAIEGVRDNQILGYGLVVGLNGTGDKRQTFFSAQTLANMLDRMGVQVTPTAILVRNTAAVMVTANLPPFAQPGTRIDIHVAAIGDATNLQGGMLLLTPLKASDGRVFAAAQGPVVTGGFAAGGGGNRTVVNHPTAGRVPDGGIVEQAPPSVASDGPVRLQLRRADFTTAARLAQAVNKAFSGGVAKPANAGLVEVDVPADWAERRVEFIATIENLTLEADSRQRVVMNERTGTIVLGKQTRIRPVSILHGNLTVEIQTSFDVSQPNPMASGETKVTPDVRVGAREDLAKNVQLKDGATVEQLVQALLAIGSTPRDVIAIMQALKSAGALLAEIEVI
ncbi:MAG: flagellar biosynthesis protein FlgA [Candidatus Solibacter sp.]|nr:flagellar biosynthesis protein FlgA [Candidatus Solibacter sp.]